MESPVKTILKVMIDGDIRTTEQIGQFFHCGRCIRELPSGESPQSYQRMQVGFTTIGIQIWCVRHDCNIAHVMFVPPEEVTL